MNRYPSNTSRHDFDDKEIYEEIKEQIEMIQNQPIGPVEKLQRIEELYKTRQAEKLRRQLIQSQEQRFSTTNAPNNSFRSMPYRHRQNHSEDEDENSEDGKVGDGTHGKFDVNNQKGSISDLGITEIGNLIRKITLTRNKLIEFSNSRRFEDLARRCFVRYHSENSSKNDSYVTAQIVGFAEGKKEYTLIGDSGVGQQKTKILLKLQESSDSIVSLPITMVSNQSPPSGNMEISQWISKNEQKIPSEKEIKEKLEEHMSLLTEKLSSEDIDRNIFKKAQMIAERKVQPKEDITNLIDFMNDRINNLENLEEEEISKRSEDKLNLMRVRREKAESKGILDNLQEIRAELKNQGKNANESQNTTDERKEKKPTLKLELKREDDIKEKSKMREMLLCTAEGAKKVKLDILENHNKYNFELDI